MEDIYIVDTVFIFIMLLFVIGGAYLMYRYSKRQKNVEAYKGEYASKTLFRPFRPGMTFSQKITSFLVSIYFWIIGLAFIGIYVYMISIDLPNTREVIFTFVAAGAIALAFSFAYAVIMWIIDSREREPLRFVPTLFLLGCIATFISAFANDFAETELTAVFGTVIAGAIVISIAGPVIEEIIKGSGVIVMSFHHEMDDMMDGILYGFIIGVGFSFMENWGYYTFYSPFEIGLVPWLSLVGLRIFGSGLLHGVFTGITGGIVGLIRKNKDPNDDKYLPFAVIPAIIVHMAYNTITNLGVLLQVSGETIIGILVVFVIFLVWVFSKVIKKALKHKKNKPLKFMGDD